MQSLIKKSLKLLIYNPYILFKKIVARTKSFFPPKEFIIKKNINGIIFEFDIDYDPIVSQMFFGGYEIETIEIMKKFLKKGDTFIDVGANIGYLTAIGAGFVSTSGQVYSFEPVPKYFQQLVKMANENSKYNIITNSIALGEKDGIIPINITSISNIGWNTIVPGLMPRNSIGKTINVPICRLDNYIIEKEMKKIALIKIDVEGYEFPVLLGLSKYFSDEKNRPPIICEIGPSAYPRIGYSLNQLNSYMQKYNYYPYDIININKQIIIEDLTQTSTILFLSKKK